MRLSRSRPTLSVLEALLWLGGFLGAGFVGLSFYEGQRTLVLARQTAPPSAGPNLKSPSAKGVPFGRLVIPAIGLTVPLISDYDANSLVRGVGHIPGTALPGGLGTMGLAGHRDTWFRPLRRVGKGMEILVSDTDGTFHYRVDSTEIVTPEQVEVLDIVDRPGMALVTCYPFDFIGAAPKRFIVHAHLLSAEADEKP